MSWTGGVWIRIPLETYIFILNFSLPPRSEQVNGAVANEIKHVHSPEVMVVLDPRYILSYKALYISTCSIAFKIYSDNRKEYIILTRLRIGHSRLTHKQYLLNEEFPECIPCDCPLTIKHVLIECVDTADIRRQYFNCSDLKTLFSSVAGGTILANLSEINLIGQI